MARRKCGEACSVSVPQKEVRQTFVSPTTLQGRFSLYNIDPSAGNEIHRKREYVPQRPLGSLPGTQKVRKPKHCPIPSSAKGRHTHQCHLESEDNSSKDADAECTFKPKINEAPKYLSNCGTVDKANPMRILRKYCELFSNSSEYKEHTQIIRECTFQPNIHKFIEREAAIQKKRLAEQTQMCSNTDDEALIDELYKELEKPFDRVFDADIRRWLDRDGDSYIKEANRDFKKSHHAVKKRYENPQYRIRRKLCGSWQCKRPYDSVPLIAIERTRGAIPELGIAAKAPVVKGAIKWREGLRGGYLPSKLQFGQENRTRKDEDKKYSKEDIEWKRYIRIGPRRVQARLLPNQALLEGVSNELAPDTTKSPPTLWNHSRRYSYSVDRGPDAHTYSHRFSKCGGLCNATYKDVPYKLPRSYSNPSAPPPVTTFTVPTPVKTHQVRRQLRIYGQFRRAVENEDIRLPPKIVGVQRDILPELEKAIQKASLFNDLNALENSAKSC